MYDRKGMPGFICADFFPPLLSQIYGLFPSVYGSRHSRQVSEDDHSCGLPNSDEPDVFTAFRVKMLVWWVGIIHELREPLTLPVS